VKTKDAGLVTATLAILLTLCLRAATLLADEAIHPAPVTATVAKTRPGYKPAPPTTVPAELPVLSSGQIVPIKLALSLRSDVVPLPLPFKFFSRWGLAGHGRPALSLIPRNQSGLHRISYSDFFAESGPGVD
jgi:hypothetical protein